MSVVLVLLATSGTLFLASHLGAILVFVATARRLERQEGRRLGDAELQAIADAVTRAIDGGTGRVLTRAELRALRVLGRLR